MTDEQKKCLMKLVSLNVSDLTKIISLITRSESFTVPTKTSILNRSSPIYVHTCVTAEAPTSPEEGDAANNE